MYIDAHCHLPQDTFPDYKTALDEAQHQGVKRVIINGMNQQDNEIIASWNHPILRRAFGLHPCTKEHDVEKAKSWIKANKKLCVAIGEIGLDLHWDTATFPEQVINFVEMLALSIELNLPVIIHSRKAETQVLEHIKEHKTPVVLHAFGGSKSLIEQGIKQKCYFSITSNIGRSDQVQQLAKLIPTSQLLTETDAPYMSKQKGVPSHPKDVVDTINHIAQIKGITPQECKNIIFMNYQRVFKD